MFMAKTDGILKTVIIKEIYRIQAKISGSMFIF